MRFTDRHDHHEPDKMLFLSGFIFWRNSYGLILISFKRSKIIVHITAQEYPAQQHCHHYIPHIIRRQQLMGGNAGCGGYRFDCKFGICKIIKSISLKKSNNAIKKQGCYGISAAALFDIIFQKCSGRSWFRPARPA